ncbi:MAG: hypothetical protein JRH00_09020 [Deltaproteobacteria bacterium]|nr:hypothetical protein [Deltaproteobacteria bacterium]
MDVSEAFSTAARKDNRVRILLGLASARCGHFEEALKYVDRLSDPRVAEIHLLAAEHFIREEDEIRAEQALSNLKPHENGERKPDIDKLKQELLDLKAKMASAWTEGRFDVALDLAKRILSTLPRNRAAQEIRRKFEKQQRQERIARLLAEADDARGLHVFAREVELLKKAIAAGADARELSERLEYARNMAEKQREEMEISQLLKLWEEGRIRESLLHFMGLTGKQRRRIAQIIHDPHFRWVEEAISSDRSISPKRVVDAALVLGRAKEGLEKTKNIHRVHKELSLHGRVLQSIPEARRILEQTESMLRALESAKNRDLLEKAQRFLTGDQRNLERAGHCLSSIKVKQLGESDKRRFSELRSRLKQMEKIQMLRQKYDFGASRGDHFICMDMAERLAEEKGEDSRYWRRKAKEHSEIVKREWSLVSCRAGELPASYGRLGIKWLLEEPVCCLFPDGRRLITATCHDRWVFVRTFSLDDQNFHDPILFRAPGKLSHPNMVLVGDTFWMAGYGACVLGLRLDPVTIRFWHDFSSSLKGDELLENALIFPSKRMFWLYKRHRETGDEKMQVISLEQGRITRKIKVFYMPIVVNRGGYFEIIMPDRDERVARVYSEEGRAIEAFQFGRFRVVSRAAIHPNGVDYVFLTYENREEIDFFEEFTDENDGQDPDFIVALETRPDVSQGGEPVRIEGLHGELYSVMASSRDAGIIFVYFASGSRIDEGMNLAAYRASERGFDLLYQVSAPERLILFSDEGSRRVGVFGGNKEMQAMVLDERPPVFDDLGNSREKGYYFPMVESIWLCDVHTGVFHADVLATALMLRDCSYKRFHEYLTEIKRSNDPDRTATVLFALKRSLRVDEAEELKIWMEERYPDHCRVLFEKAKRAAKERNWPETISLLERITPHDLDDGSACHRCHILGMAYFAEGRVKSALSIWEEGTRYEEGQCDLDPCITCARLSLMSEEERKKTRIRDDMRRGLDLYEAVDQYMKINDWDRVIAVVESADALESSDIQLMARLARAYLSQEVLPGSVRFMCKVLVLANYCELHEDAYSRKDHIFPTCIEVWPDERLRETARQASEWLDAL